MVARHELLLNVCMGDRRERSPQLQKKSRWSIPHRSVVIRGETHGSPDAFVGKQLHFKLVPRYLRDHHVADPRAKNSRRAAGSEDRRYVNRLLDRRKVGLRIHGERGQIGKRNRGEQDKSPHILRVRSLSVLGRLSA